MNKGIGITGPDGKPSPIKQDPNFNLAMSQDVVDILSEKCERIKQLEKYCEEVKEQAEKEVGELKQMVEDLTRENLRLKELLKEQEVD